MKTTDNLKSSAFKFICLILVLYGAYKLFADAYKETRADAATFAMCISANGVYGGGKCFVNGVELKNESGD